MIEGLPWTRKIVDDILVWAEMEEELMERTRIILSRCKEHNITISRKKLELGTERVTVQDPASKKWPTTAIVLEEREHGNSYVLTTEGTEKKIIRGERLLKPHSFK